jgi:ubiquinol-cytochrome c reductase cytochrome c subunit
MTPSRSLARSAGLCLLALGLPAVPALAAAPANPGRAVFLDMGCYLCHGVEGQGARATGPALAPRPFPLAAMKAYVRAPTGQMPPYSADILSDAQLGLIHDYLASIPQGRTAAEIPLLGGTAPRPAAKPAPAR